jgi:tetratricopeptide (TPR) repeat protein
VALAAGEPVTSETRDPVLDKVSEATKRQDWVAAAALLKDAVASDPNNANYHNLYAYSIRKGANPDMSLVFKHYNEALRIDPKHRGAHEYIGEAYLIVGNLEKAKEHLGQLDKLCFFPCIEYTDLKKAIAQYESKR